MPDPIVPPVVVPPATLKVGDKEYTPEQIAELEKSVAEKEEQFKSLQSDYSKKSARLSELEKADLKSEANKINSGETDLSNLSDQQKEDLKYMADLGFITPKKLEEVVSKVKEETTKEVEEKLTKKEKLAQTEQKIKDLKVQYPFIDEDKLKEYLSERAKAGTLLTEEEGVTLLYRDNILANGVKPIELPGVESGKKGIIEEPKPKILPLGSAAMNERIAERLNKVS